LTPGRLANDTAPHGKETASSEISPQEEIVKLASYRIDGRPSYGLVFDDGLADLGGVAAEFGETLRQALERNALERIVDWAASSKSRIPFDAIDFLPVIPDPQKIFCVGINYRSHVVETGREVPAHPMIFTRFADSQVGHLQPIRRPKVSDKLDFEGELAVVIGRPGRYIAAGRALEHVAGYSIYNDGTLRDWQRHSIQFIPGKNFPQTGAFGPWLVTADDIPDPSKLALTTRLNGEVVQRCTTDDMIFSVQTLVEYCSSFTTLAAGDVIITGTTGGVGAFRQPPLWMKPGDVVEVDVPRIGTLRNPVADE
jgi:2-keto-4-pentenoate hydratase/2-oxohepta-3-ene-1,7-dioic acid hydratase in catechol pathway